MFKSILLHKKKKVWNNMRVIISLSHAYTFQQSLDGHYASVTLTSGGHLNVVCAKFKAISSVK